jgi:hypothetical protein
MYTNWVQIEMGKTLKTIKVDHNNFFNYKIFPYFYVIETCSKFGFDFKFYIIQRFNILVKSINLHVNHKSHISTIIVYHTKFLKTLNFFCAC